MASNRYRPSYAFDDSTSNEYSTDALQTSDTLTRYVYLNLPDKISIKPTSIQVKHRYSGNSTYPCYVQGYVAGNWYNLATLTSGSSANTETFAITNERYYSRFRLLLRRYSSTNQIVTIYDFKITAGTIKIEE